MVVRGPPARFKALSPALRAARASSSITHSQLRSSARSLTMRSMQCYVRICTNCRLCRRMLTCPVSAFLAGVRRSTGLTYVHPPMRSHPSLTGLLVGLVRCPSFRLRSSATTIPMASVGQVLLLPLFAVLKCPKLTFPRSPAPGTGQSQCKIRELYRDAWPQEMDRQLPVGR